MPLTPDAKNQLSKTIRDLRATLLEDLRKAADSAYRLAVPLEKAGLAESAARKRQRLEGWLGEQVRASTPKKGKKPKPAALRERHLDDAIKRAAATYLNRLVVLRLMEAQGLVKPALIEGGYSSKAYQEFREFGPAFLQAEDEGFGMLLELVCDELSQDLPGLFGDVGLSSLFPTPPQTLRRCLDALNDPALDTAWDDDTTLGWVYQYWNDPEREALDVKINNRQKIEPHEIASKTQMFTERYMVDWLLQNTLGPMWLAICKKNAWVADAASTGALDALETRRADWREKRDSGEVEETALMPLSSALEQRWAYFVPQPLPDDAVTHAPDSIRDLKMIDPACGSGHFLVIAFDLLFALYQEEARHRGEEWSAREIAESILENNLHGVDIDPWAVQIAAAALWLKARAIAGDVHPRRINLVASNLNLGQLASDDPAIVELRHEIARDTDIAPELVDAIITALAGADHLGTLLKIEHAVADAIAKHNQGHAGDLFDNAPTGRGAIDATQQSILASLERFLQRTTESNQLGLRLRGEQLAAGVRFIQVAREDAYHIVVANPPYQGTSKMADTTYVKKHYPRGKADLFAAFLERGLQLARPGGVSAMVTMRNWMFIKQYEKLRTYLLGSFDLRSLGDFDRGAFDEVPNEVLAITISIFRKAKPTSSKTVAQLPTPHNDTSYDRGRTDRKRAAVLCQRGRFEFDLQKLKGIEGWPVVYWWGEEFLNKYINSPKMSEAAPVRYGSITGDDTRFLKKPWEVSPSMLWVKKYATTQPANSPLTKGFKWLPFIKGARGRKWFEPLQDMVDWASNGLQCKSRNDFRFGTYSRLIQNESWYFTQGIAFVTVGADFSGRLHLYESVFGSTACSVFPDDRISEVLLLVNSSTSNYLLQSLNPTIHFTNGDVNRLPIFHVADAEKTFQPLALAFEREEKKREPSVEYKRPNRSDWTYAQDWAQRAIDRPEGTPLPPYEPQYDPEPPTDHVSFAVGVALGRFGANGEGILNPDEEPPQKILPHGLLYLSGYRPTTDSLAQDAAKPILDAWATHGAKIDEKRDVRSWLQARFFADVHVKMYDKRPIYFPLSSARKNFVALGSIHRWQDNTLQTLLAEHLIPDRTAMDGELTDLMAARSSSDAKTRRDAEQRYDEVVKLKEELDTFIEAVRQCADQGPPPSDGKTEARKADAPYRMDLDDGVMVNSSALWPLLQPQWKDPKKWWKELANCKGKKDYDWSHLAARYFPERVDAKCKTDPSLGVAHGCFWRYHPANAYKWELRLQDEIAADFTIDEADSDACRAKFLAENAKEAASIKADEMKRRKKNAEKAQKSLDL